MSGELPPALLRGYDAEERPERHADENLPVQLAVPSHVCVVYALSGGLQQNSESDCRPLRFSAFSRVFRCKRLT